jgi:O-antigen/teichoic acid export membrane protein
MISMNKHIKILKIVLILCGIVLILNLIYIGYIGYNVINIYVFGLTVLCIGINLLALRKLLRKQKI